MKCVKIAGAKMVESSTINKPVSRDGSVVIKVNSCGICGSDIHYFVSGEPKGLVMGHEFSGEVVDPGSRKDLKMLLGFLFLLVENVRRVKLEILNIALKHG